MKLVVASTNPVKIQAALTGFQQMFPDQTWETQGLSAPSGVADQPMSCDETYQGALNRLRHVRQAQPDADFWLGIEGGLEEVRGELAASAWILIASRDRFGKARTGTFFLAPQIETLVRNGMEMGPADDLVFKHEDSKRNLGASGILTGGIIDRAALYAHAVVLALIPFKNPDHYPAQLDALQKCRHKAKAIVDCAHPQDH